MILTIDYGEASAKVLSVDENEFHLTEVTLGFKQFPQWSLNEALEYIITQALGDREAEAVYAVGEIASVKLKEILSAPPLDPSIVYQKLDIPVIDIGHSTNYVSGKIWRGRCSEDDILNFLPFSVSTHVVNNYFSNKVLYPQIVPYGDMEHALEHASTSARVAITQRMVGNELPFDEVVLTGSVFAKAANPGIGLLSFLNGAKLPPVCHVYLDSSQLLPALPALAFYEPDLAQKILEAEPFIFLGTVFSNVGDTVLSLNSGLAEEQEIKVKENDVVCLPLEPGKTLGVSFRSGNRSGNFEAEGGVVGLVLDTRPKPVEMSKDMLLRKGVWQTWQEAFCTHPLLKK